MGQMVPTVAVSAHCCCDGDAGRQHCAVPVLCDSEHHYLKQTCWTSFRATEKMSESCKKHPPSTSCFFKPRLSVCLMHFPIGPAHQVHTIHNCPGSDSGYYPSYSRILSGLCGLPHKQISPLGLRLSVKSCGLLFDCRAQKIFFFLSMGVLYPCSRLESEAYLL